MSKYQTNQDNILSDIPSTFQTISQMLERCCEAIYSPWAAGRQSRIIAKLNPNIRCDIGELDCRSQSSTLQAMQTAQQASLEMMLLRSI
jgi:hypothetical protein